MDFIGVSVQKLGGSCKTFPWVKLRHKWGQISKWGHSLKNRVNETGKRSKGSERGRENGERESRRGITTPRRFAVCGQEQGRWPRILPSSSMQRGLQCFAPHWAGITQDFLYCSFITTPSGSQLCKWISGVGGVFSVTAGVSTGVASAPFSLPLFTKPTPGQ